MRTTIFSALVLALAVAACDSRKTTTPPSTQTYESKITTSAWVRLAARPDLPASGYFDVKAEGKVGPLQSVTADKARIEMHESTNHGGMASMQPIGGASFDHGRIRFEPGGKHLMIYGLPAGLKAGDTLELVFHFQGVDPSPVEANVIGPGDPEPDDWRLAR